MAQTNKARVDSGLHAHGAETIADALLDPTFLAAYAAAEPLVEELFEERNQELDVLDAEFREVLQED